MLATVALLGALVTAYIVNWGVEHNPVEFMDLSVYRLGVQAWLHGQDMYGTLPPTVAGNRLPFIYPPFAAIPFVPMTWVSWTMTWWISTAISVAALALVIWLTARRVWPTYGWRAATLATSILLPASLVLQPVTDTLWFGQVNMLLMALVAADLLVEKPRWPRGVLIGIAAAVKLTPAGFVLVFLLRKDYRSTRNTVLAAVAATLLGFAANWSGSTRFWFGDTGLGRAAQAMSANNQTVRAALERMNLPTLLQDGLWLGLAALVFGMVVVAIRRAYRAQAPDALPLAMVLTAALILTASPTAWGHHWVYVVPALVVLIGRGMKSFGWALAAAVVALVFWVRPFAPPPRTPVFWWRLFDSPPQLPTEDHRMHWALAEHLYANPYVLVTLTLLALLVFGHRTAKNAVQDDPSVAPNARRGSLWRIAERIRG